MKKYYYENHATEDDKLAAYLLMTETDYGDEWYREIHGISFDEQRIDNIITELQASPYVSEETKYIVHRVPQMKDELFHKEFQPSGDMQGECYIVIRGPAVEMMQEYLGYFKKKHHAIEYAEIADNFIGTDEIIIINATIDSFINYAYVKTASAEDGFEFE